MTDIQLGVIGMRITITVTENGAALDISTATVKKIILRSSLGAGKIKTAAFLTDGADGKVYYDTVAGDIDTESTWMAQVYYEMGTFKGYTEPVEVFTANPNLATVS